MMTYAEFKRLDIYKAAENGIGIDANIPEEELNGMDVKGYFLKNGLLILELGESIAEFEDLDLIELE